MSKATDVEEWKAVFLAAALSKAKNRRVRAKKCLQDWFPSVVDGNDDFEVLIAKVRGLARAIDEIDLSIKTIKIKKYMP